MVDRLIRSSRKSLALEITKEGTVIVRAPYRISKKQIDWFVSTHQQWIEQKKQEILSRPQRTPHKFAEGEIFYFLGVPLQLKFSRLVSEITVEGPHLLIPELIKNIVQREITVWYQQQARKRLLSRLKELSEKYQLPYQSAKVTGAEKRWGSCSGKNGICLTWRLVMAPPVVADSVMIHELCHTKAHDHSPRFWKLVYQLMPEYNQHSLWLKENGNLLYLDSAETE